MTRKDKVMDYVYTALKIAFVLGILLLAEIALT